MGVDVVGDRSWPALEADRSWRAPGAARSGPTLGADRSWQTLEAERLDLAAVPRSHAAWRRLELEEIHSSTAFAGSGASAAEVLALVEQGLTPGGRQLAECIMVADYAAAARYVREAPPAGRRQPFLRTDEIVAIHAHALRRTPEALPGVWRRNTIPAFPSGMVAPPAWLISRDVAAFVDRFAIGPPPEGNPLLWLADAHARFTRIQPFAAGNGRVTRLVTNLLLRRLGLPPFVVRERDRRRYAVERVPAGARRLRPLAALLGQSLLASTAALLSAAGDDAELRPLATFATGSARAALYKAAQRDRLRTVRRGTALLTTAAWIAAYHESRSAGAGS